MLTGQIKKSFTRIWLGFLVGVAAGLPDLRRKPPRDVRLGDVIISLPDQDCSGIIQYDFGKQTTKGFENRSRLPQTESLIRSVFGNMRDLAELRGHKFLTHLQRLQDVKNEDGTLLFAYPGQDKDKLYQTIEHTKDDNVEREELVNREPRDDRSRTQVWYVGIGGEVLFYSNDFMIIL